MRSFIVILFLAVAVAVATETSSDFRITNGQTARTGQFKYQVGLLIKKLTPTGDTEDVLCGGALISPTWILTAAHCIEGAYRVFAFLGGTGYLAGDAFRAVDEAFIHSNWEPKNAANDICLLRISGVRLSNNIAPVALPPLYSTNSYQSYLNQNVIASGWGKINDLGSIPSSLQYASLKVVPDSVCLKSYGYKNFRLSNICTTGVRPTSTCNGDSGGPLVTESSQILVGIISYGSLSGCTKGYPQVFTRVSSYREWIRQVSGV